jgi:class 3 adenylate cyclase
MVLNAFRALYRRFGGRYPRLVIWLQLQFALVVVFAGLGLLTVYQPVGGDFWRIFAVAEGLTLIENVFAYRMISKMLRPADAWLRGDRSNAAVTTAWSALAELPAKSVKKWKPIPIVFNIVPLCVYITLELHLTLHSIAFLFAGSVVVLAYGLFLRFFAMELALRPVIEQVSRDLPASFRLRGDGVSLRTRLMLAMPLLNVIGGVVVAGLSAQGTATLEDLGFDVAIAVAVAFTISLELTYLLARSIVDPVVQLQKATARVSEGDLDVQVPVASNDETGQLAQSFNQAVAGLAERRRLYEAFGAYVDPEVARRVLREGVSMDGEEVEVTILFLDIRGFTALAERSSARELVTLLNDFFDAVVPVLTRHGGHANKFVGDGLLGVFGAPDRLTDHADRAVACAVDLAALVRERWKGAVEVGIGLNSGPVVAGTVGGGGRVDFTVIGDPVNTAARVEEATRVSGDTVLVTAATRALLLRDRWEWQERPPVPLKGKTETVALFALLSADDGSRGAPAGSAATISPA